MKNPIIRLFFTFLLSAGLSSAAFAHPNMTEYSITHIGLHIVASVGIYIVIMLAGIGVRVFYFQQYDANYYPIWYIGT